MTSGEIERHGRTVEVSGIETEYFSEPVYVYNLEVEDYHTYFVSELGVLVHNNCGPGTGNKGGRRLDNQRGIGGKGWRGDKTWKQNVNSVREGDTILDFNGQVPTQQEAIDLINEAGGKINRIEGPHNPPNPHNFNHINFTTSEGKKGTIKIQ